MKSLNKTNYAVNGDMSADVNGTSLDISRMLYVSFVAVVSSASSLVGSLEIQVSNDNMNWASSSAAQSNPSDGAYALSLSDTGFRYCRLVWDRTSGTGTLSAAYSGKGVQ